MRTDPQLRGQRDREHGCWSHVLDDARSRGASSGSRSRPAAWTSSCRRGPSTPRAGFVPCPPFGSYVDDPHSTFMTMVLAPR